MPVRQRWAALHVQASGKCRMLAASEPRRLASGRGGRGGGRGDVRLVLVMSLVTDLHAKRVGGQ